MVSARIKEQFLNNLQLSILYLFIYFTSPKTLPTEGLNLTREGRGVTTSCLKASNSFISTQVPNIGIYIGYPHPSVGKNSKLSGKKKNRGVQMSTKCIRARATLLDHKGRSSGHGAEGSWLAQPKCPVLSLPCPCPIPACQQSPRQPPSCPAPHCLSWACRG